MELNYLKTRTWYKKNNVLFIFIYLLLRVDKDGICNNESRDKISMETNISIKIVRTSLKILSDSGDLVIKNIGKNNAFFIPEFEKYMGNNNVQSIHYFSGKKSSKNIEPEKPKEPELSKIETETLEDVSAHYKNFLEKNGSNMNLTRYDTKQLTELVKTQPKEAILKAIESCFIKDWFKDRVSVQIIVKNFSELATYNGNGTSGTSQKKGQYTLTQEQRDEILSLMKSSPLFPKSKHDYIVENINGGNNSYERLLKVVNQEIKLQTKLKNNLTEGI